MSRQYYTFNVVGRMTDLAAFPVRVETIVLISVVWNPKSMWDRFGLAEDEDKTYICVEPGKVTRKVNLAPGKTWECSMMLTAGKA